jgi:prepilin-type N-terminal cleavage/methylation domain-containing protein
MKPSGRPSYASGFTLLELMIVVALIGILSAIAIPIFRDTIAKSQEAQVKGNFGTLRSALSIYYADTEGSYPYDDLHSLIIGGKYLRAIPPIRIPAIGNVNPGHLVSSTVCATYMPICDDQGGWGYQSDPTNPALSAIYATPDWGTVLVNCIHRDSKGSIWYLFGSN